MTWIDMIDLTGVEPLFIVTLLFTALLVLSLIENVVDIGIKRLIAIIGISAIFVLLGGIIYLIYLFLS
jgi:hypothetical protein